MLHKVKLLMLAGLVLLGQRESFGQTAGTITGEVKDSSGAMVTGATVTLTDQATNATRVATTNTDGLFVFPTLVPGKYSLQVKMSGFKLNRSLISICRCSRQCAQISHCSRGR